MHVSVYFNSCETFTSNEHVIVTSPWLCNKNPYRMKQLTFQTFYTCSLRYLISIDHFCEVIYIFYILFVQYFTVSIRHKKHIENSLHNTIFLQIFSKNSLLYVISRKIIYNKKYSSNTGLIKINDRILCIHQKGVALINNEKP